MRVVFISMLLAAMLFPSVVRSESSLVFDLSQPAAFEKSLEDITENFDAPSEQDVIRARAEIDLAFGGLDVEPAYSLEQEARIMSAWSHLDPQKVVPRTLLDKTMLYFEEHKGAFANRDYVTVVDFSPKSEVSRMFVVNLGSGAVKKYHVTHGSGSDVDDDGIAESFGNVVNSRKSSLGFVRVSEVYYGRFGRSIRIDGLSSTNSRVRERAVVIHGWEKIKEVDARPARSAGCFAIGYSVTDEIIDMIKEGSLMYAGVSGR